MQCLEWNCYLTRTKQKGLHIFDHGVTAYELKVPGEKLFQSNWWAGIQGMNMSCFQRHVPHVQVSDVPEKGLCEIPTKRVLILTQDQNPITIYIPVNVCVWAHVAPVPINIDGPVVAASVPRHTDVVPCAIIYERRFVWQVLPMDY